MSSALFLNILVLFIVAIVSAITFFFKWKFTYWEKRGIPFREATVPYGNLAEAGKTKHLSTILQELYHEMKDKATFCGMYFFTTPNVLLLDLDLVKNVLVKDFQYFHDRGVYFNEKDDPLSAHLFSIEGTKWRNLRAKLTPTFTSGKMKMMCPTITAVGEKFRDFMSTTVAENPEIEMRDILARFTTDVIGTCAFGLECNSLGDPNAKFRQMGRKIFEPPKNRLIKRFFILQSRSLARFLGITTTNKETAEFFLGAVKDTVRYREEKNIQRNDFMDLLIKLKKTNESDQEKLTLNEISAQAFIFFLAGFETSSTAMSFALYEFSLNQEVQEKARQCVRRVLKKYDGKMTYEAIQELDYIDQCINESLRKYPPVPVLNREATKDYLVPGTKHVFRKGMSIILPVYAIHHDPEIYPDPEVYDPDRFSPEEMKKRNPIAFLPFGEGPRVCIGLRFGMMQARIGLAFLLDNFKFSTCSKSVVPLVFSKTSFILTPASGLWLKVEKITSE